MKSKNNTIDLANMNMQALLVFAAFVIIFLLMYLAFYR